ncbi:MAG: aromatic ring hydroxylase [Deltaproteobacteria bacterium]|uniref:Aromatic ring hydroxylase n=1 Tax=Candidatus Zymogenus saltonus TaxID=2844893 RepID=A0A9D8KG55_9DELT|nr:aromatic ring hydroxylase [Candidatus Zymogenus saltonus]
MRTKDEYFEDLKGLKPNIYIGGEVVGRDDPRIQPGKNIIALTFDAQEDSERKELVTATSHLDGANINRFTHVHRGMEDLLAKQKMTRILCRDCGSCIQRCMGVDAINALSAVTYDCDKDRGTEYNGRFLEFLKRFQKGNMVGCCAQSDVKGDRTKRPHQQTDPDLYLRIVERKKDGIVVRGAKAHNTMAPYAEEIIAIPTRFLTPEETDWAVAFAVPADTPGVRLLTRVTSVRPRRPEIDAPYVRLGAADSLTVFDDVFVPNERVFLCGETEYGGRLALLFALFHRHSYTGCKPAVTDIMMGAAALVSEYNGIERSTHVRDKLAELVSVAELTYSAGIAAAVESTKHPSGTQIPNVVYCNVGRRHAGLNIYHEYETVCDLAGGLPATLPYDEEFLSPEVGHLLKKYIKRKDDVSAEDQYRCFRFISDVSVSALGGVLQYAGVHGGGSPVMENIAIMGTYDIEEKKRLVKKLAGIAQ